MSTGLYWDERAHEPFALITILNFYDDLEKFTINDLYDIREPGEIQHYDSGGTQILGTVIKRVLKVKSITDYLPEKFWQPLGYEYDGLFILDSREKANEKTYGGLVTTARDVSKQGHLILNNGTWNGKQILSPRDMKLIKTIPYNNEAYTYGFWTGIHEGSRFYYQSGFRGQFCISFPAHNLLITRLGHKTTPRERLNDVGPDIYEYIKEALRVVKESGIE